MAATTISSTTAAVVSDEVWPPGFRFHPTDEELILYYLKRKISRRNFKLDIIADVDVYKCEPHELPGLSLLKNGDRQWFFFSPRDRKYPNGSRANRATRQGYWKATGKDRTIVCNSRNVGIKKTLVFYFGRAPSGQRTDWVMHEYVLEENELRRCQNIYDYYVIYKLFKKSGPGPKNGEQYGAPFKEEDWAEDDCPSSSAPQQVVNVSPTYSCRNAQVDSLVSDISELLNSIPDQPAPSPVISEPAPLPVISEPAPLPVISEPAPLPVISEPAPLQAYNELATWPAYNQPTTSQACNQPATSQAYTEPATSQAYTEPASLQANSEPASVYMDDFEEALSQFLGQEEKQGMVTNLSCEEANKLILDNDFIQMDDLLGPEPVQGLGTSFAQPTGSEISDNRQFQVEDGLSEFDFYYDADALHQNFPSTDALHQNFPSNDQILLPAQCSMSQDSGSVNQTNFEVHSYTNQGGLQSYSTDISSFRSDMWSYDANPDLVNSYFVKEYTPLPSTGVIDGVNSTSISTELNQNQEVERAQPWSSTLWSFVDSIPAAPASAADSDLLNKAFQRMSSFGRIRLNSRSSVSAAAGCVNKSSSVGLRGSGKMKGYFVLSFLAALFAVACVFLGLNANVFGKLHCPMNL